VDATPNFIRLTKTQDRKTRDCSCIFHTVGV